MWLIHEAIMVLVVLVLRWRILRREAPERPEVRFAGRVLGYVAIYYALFFAVDVAIVSLRSDLAWLLRCAPYQLYLSFYLPFVWATWPRLTRPQTPASP